MSDYLIHHGILGQKWGVRRYQNEDGSLTAAGRKRYLDVSEKYSSSEKEYIANPKSRRAQKAYYKAAKEYGKSAAELRNKIFLDDEVDSAQRDIRNEFRKSYAVAEQTSKDGKMGRITKSMTDHMTDSLRNSVARAIGSDASEEEIASFLAPCLNSMANSLSFQAWELADKTRFKVEDGRIVVDKEHDIKVVY